jgi:lipoate-protein ligase A
VTDGWQIEERVAPAGELHASWASVVRDPEVRAVARCRPTATAVVLGSTQPVDTVDPVALSSSGWDLVRRRSGGGAVLVAVDDPVWIDVWVPSGDPLATSDVTAAFAWLGDTWAAALRRIGLTGIDVQGRGPGTCTRWSHQVCFGGIGSGEVTVEGRKVVGLSQRRNRHGAWFHGACLVRWEPTDLLAVLAIGDGEREAATAGLRAAATGVVDAAAAQGLTPVPSPGSVVAAFLDALP